MSDHESGCTGNCRVELRAALAEMVAGWEAMWEGIKPTGNHGGFLRYDHATRGRNAKLAAQKLLATVPAPAPEVHRPADADAPHGTPSASDYE